MAFHGNRGASRGRGSNSGGFRVKGGPSNGPGRGGGGMRRGRGGRGRPIFDSTRLAEQKQGDAESSEGQAPSSSESGDGNGIEDSSSEEDDDDELPAVRPYTALLQSLVFETSPPNKKRKIDHIPVVNNINSPDADEGSDGTDAEEVDEPEEGPETAIDGVLEEDDEEENDQDSSDPFEAHFAHPDENVLSQRLNALQKNQWVTTTSSIPDVGKMILSTPGDTKSSSTWMPPVVSGTGSLKLKQKLGSSMESHRPEFDPLERTFASCSFNYRDLLYCERTTANSESIRRLACLHAVNHVFKTRNRVIKNNARLTKEENNDNLELRDQGFTRPKILVLLPTRGSCVNMVNMITSICEPEQQENRKRFEESFVETDDLISSDKPQDFRELFSGKDDNNDNFRLGLKFTRKTVKYFSQFYNSDIILASPLGLRRAIGTEDDKKVDHDYLSSIEIVIVDQADAILMQNWDHVEFIFDRLTLQPKEAHGCDFSRVRNWYLDNNAGYFRQTIALCAFNTPELNTLFYNRSKNWAGKIKIQPMNYPGALQELGLKVKQTFSRLESPSFSTDHNTRFTYFTTTIVPSLTRRSKDVAGTMIFIPSYLDFVRVRNYFVTSATTASLSFGLISEYTSDREVARARSHFLTGRHKILLYTERRHHFWRYQIRGVRNVIMYSLPENPMFYKEIVGGYLGRSTREGKLEPGQGTVRVLFSKWDVMKLERVAGTERVGKMIKDKGDTFDFV